MDDGRRVIDGYTTIAEFLDVKGFWDYLKKKNDALRRGRNKWIIASELVANLISRFIDSSKAPEGVNMKYLIANILWRRDYKALGELHYKSVFLGMMHFQDLYNYDIQRVKRCDISYLSPDGRVIPF
ncbi:MAG: radical SAM protein, partial [Candidatus Thorarchaeota archaeon]|nr:radical SAM protein [Candidatus Thorarchaeota archaeon]